MTLCARIIVRCSVVFTLLLLTGCAWGLAKQSTPNRLVNIQDVKHVLANLDPYDPNDTFDNSFYNLNADEMDVAVGIIASAYWEQSVRDKLNVQEPEIILLLGNAFTDRSIEELLRIARYSNDPNHVGQALNRLSLRRSLESLPTYAQIKERTDLPESVRKTAHYREAFTLFPLSFSEVFDALENSEVFDKPFSQKERQALYAEIEERITNENLELAKKMSENNRILRLRKSRGDTNPSFVVSPFPGLSMEERKVLDSISQ